MTGIDLSADMLGQRAVETVTVPLAGEHFRRRPHDDLVELGLVIGHHERFGLGIVERLVAHRRPGGQEPGAAQR